MGKIGARHEPVPGTVSSLNTRIHEFFILLFIILINEI